MDQRIPSGSQPRKICPRILIGTSASKFHAMRLTRAKVKRQSQDQNDERKWSMTLKMDQSQALKILGGGSMTDQRLGERGLLSHFLGLAYGNNDRVAGAFRSMVISWM